MSTQKLGILAAGGPAPGINSVIAAATIRARLSGAEVLGIRDGFSWIMNGNLDHIDDLTIENVTQHHYRGGSFIGINRANPVRDNKLEATVESLKKLGVNALICIGGDGTAYTAARVLETAKGAFRVVHVPKTIDNDLILPYDVPTFGFETARAVGVRIVQDLHMDARTTSRWYFIVTMGRQAGHLALGIGQAASSTLTLIPEEFPEKVSLSTVVDTLAGAIIKRLVKNDHYGIAVIAEGLLDKIDPEDLKALVNAAGQTMHGGMRYSDVNFASMLKTLVYERLRSLPTPIEMRIQARNVGYELRCTDPVPFDMQYTRELGYAATKYLLEGGDGAMVTLQRGEFQAVPFADILDTTTKRTRVRNVDINSVGYKIARRYMIRLRRDDFESEEAVTRMAAVAGMAPDQFSDAFKYVTAHEPPRLKLIPMSNTPTDPPEPSSINW